MMVQCLIKNDLIKDLDLPKWGTIRIRAAIGESVDATLVSLKLRPYPRHGYENTAPFIEVTFCNLRYDDRCRHNSVSHCSQTISDHRTFTTDRRYRFYKRQIEAACNDIKVSPCQPPRTTTHADDHRGSRRYGWSSGGRADVVVKDTATARCQTRPL